MSETIISKANEAVRFLKSKCETQANVGVILGSGLGNFEQNINIEKEVSYKSIPNFPMSTVEGHSGKLIFGEMAGKKIVVMSGRFHYYEGYTPQDIVFPVRILKLLGVNTLLLSNAAGGVNPAFHVGDIMIIKDHISFCIPNPLTGRNIDQWGKRFPDMSEPYKQHLISKANQIGKRTGIQLHEGVYFAVAGPTYETRAEYQLIRLAGADAVGMSTVQECIVANHMGMDVFAVSIITDLGIRKEANVITHEEVLKAAHNAEPQLTRLFTELIKII